MISPVENFDAQTPPEDMVDERYPEVLFGKSYANFCKSIRNVSPKTKKAYSKRLAEFLIDHQSNSEDFYTWIVDHHDKDDERDTEALEQLLTAYYNHLLIRKEKPYKFMTVISYVK